MSSTKRTKTLANAAKADTPPSRSAETVANNDDLLNEILLRLPFKSLLRFKSVSKHWLSLISEPNFSLRRNSIIDSISGLYFPRSRTRIARMSNFDLVNLEDLTSKSSKTPFRSLPFADSDHPCEPEIVQSCNGLLLCFLEGDDRRVYFVYNPTTKLYTKLPPVFPDDREIDDIYGLSLAFDPSISPHYKVVCVRAGDTNVYQVQIYSSETRCWSLSGDSFYFDSDRTDFQGGVYCNGSVHWVDVWEPSAYFNIEQGQISPLPMPPVLDEENYWYLDHIYRYFGESRGHLHLIENRFDLQSRFDVLEMEMDYSGWFVKFRVDLSDFPRVFPEIVRTYQGNPAFWLKFNEFLFAVLCVVRSEVDEESYLVLQIPGKVIRYNFKTGTFFKLCDYEPGSDFPAFLWPHAHQHSESLAVV